MNTEICQSCGGPLTAQNRGTNRDQSLNEDFCFACFKNGEFTDHHLTMHHLEVELLEMAEVHNEISLEEAQRLIKLLPDLKRWRMNSML